MPSFRDVEAPMATSSAKTVMAIRFHCVQGLLAFSVLGRTVKT
jgi:hypothetical protein